ncbi:hypothetical protein SO694_00015154 [Aureococcus anophagefferens]|uniref:Uncharacterized protein n=1 Tax=Aureococcus anophagefferens TaxID=44056 RepID=A0ABR1G367_AURAN
MEKDARRLDGPRPTFSHERPVLDDLPNATLLMRAEPLRDARRPRRGARRPPRVEEREGAVGASDDRDAVLDRADAALKAAAADIADEAEEAAAAWHAEAKKAKADLAKLAKKRARFEGADGDAGARAPRPDRAGRLSSRALRRGAPERRVGAREPPADLDEPDLPALVKPTEDHSPAGRAAYKAEYVRARARRRPRSSRPTRPRSPPRKRRKKASKAAERADAGAIDAEIRRRRAAAGLTPVQEFKGLEEEAVVLVDFFGSADKETAKAWRDLFKARREGRGDFSDLSRRARSSATSSSSTRR